MDLANIATLRHIQKTVKGLYVGLLACLLIFTFSCRSLSPDWNGTWKADPSKGNYGGPTFIISISLNGDYRYESSSSSFTFRCDGKDRDIGQGRTRTCFTRNAKSLSLDLKENGLKKAERHWELSADGEVLTITAFTFSSGEASVVNRITASRVSGKNGFTGEWRDTDYSKTHSIMRLATDGKILHIGYPLAGQYIDAPLNGAYAAVNGPHAPEGLAYTANVVGRRKILMLAERAGKAVTQESMELDKGGGTITYSWWDREQPSAKGVFVYERQ